jgi:hypothetical protein
MAGSKRRMEMGRSSSWMSPSAIRSRPTEIRIVIPAVLVKVTSSK